LHPRRQASIRLRDAARIYDVTELLERLRAARQLAFLFTGGSTRCAFQVGVAECLAELGVRPTRVLGVSGGGWNAAAVAAGRTRRLRYYWKYFARAPHFDISNVTRDFTPFRYAYLHERAFERYIGRENLVSDSAIPMWVGITRLDTRESIVLSVREVPDPFRLILASNYLPPFYTRPVSIDGVDCGDGGLSNNLPYESLLGEGADLVLIISTNGESAGGLFRNPREVDHVIPPAFRDRVVALRPRHRLPVSFVEWRWPRLENTMNLGYLRAREALLGENHPRCANHSRSIEPVRSALRFMHRLRSGSRKLRRHIGESASLDS
jgi:predicted acylesterase/phospholipase RssA